MAGRALSELLAAAEELRARERAEFARRLHDEAGGRLTAAAIDLTLLRMDAPPELQAQMQSLEQKLELAFESVRGVSLAAAPDLAARIPLAEAISKLGESVLRNFNGRLEISVDSEYCPGADLSLALFRIVELLVSYLAFEANARVIGVTVGAGPRVTAWGNAVISREAAGRNLEIALARYHSLKHNLRFMLGSRDSASTIFVIGGQEE